MHAVTVHWRSPVTQFPHAGYYDPTIQPDMPPAKRSGLAVTALVLSLIGIVPCCAITAPLGVLLGLIGLVAIRPPKYGKGMCLVAVLIGILATALWTWVAIWGYEKAKPIFEGPRQALHDGFAGNLGAFKGAFASGATVSDDQARAFIEDLRARYGEFQAVAMDQTSTAQPQFGQQEFPMPYVITFSKQQVDAEATFVMADQTGWVQKWRSITIIDPQLGNLTFPPGTGAPSAAPGGSASPPGGSPPSTGGTGNGGTGSGGG
jgi:hypothetical protein